ncbi:MAG TPA: cytochrome-c peroxidase, partial [Methylomirabilota bacterium]|nr:cytochrome-c peroxidase [Methylomirabilota bacterium]
MLVLALLLDSSPAAADPLPLPAAPKPPELGNFVQNEAAAVQLGKALFWDTQVGSDGRTACATCHFHAGTDARVRNTINPKGDGFQIAGPDGTVTAADFPFHRLADPDDTHSAVLFDTNDVVGAQGVAVARFIDITPGVAEDRTDPFPMAGLRQVTGLNTPSVINAVFNHRNFWNGRAQFEFNGVSPFGRRDPNARVLRFDSGAGTTALVGVILTNASLASQAVGPPNNQVEMAAEGRTFAKLGKKMLSLQPLGRQAVAADDSVLFGIRHPSGTGLSTSYSALIQAAFRPEWWASGVIVDANGNRVASPTPGSTNQFSQMEFNFSLFWGLSVQLYETTLVANQTRFDRFLAGDNNALNDQEKVGFSIFGGKGQCDKCHSGPELTRASVAQVTGRGLVELINLADGARGIPA